MSFITTLPRYDLIEKQAATPTGGIANVGKVGYQQQFDVINGLNGDVIVASSVTPRADAFTALNAAVASPTAIRVAR
jgi:hypothetical protein